MNYQLTVQCVMEHISFVEKFPEKFQPIILAELLHRDRELEPPVSNRVTKRQKQVEAHEDPKVKKQSNGTHQRILELRNAGFLDEPKTDMQVMAELEVRGFRYPRPQIATGLLRLARIQELRRVKDSNGTRTVYKYQNQSTN